MSKIKIKYLDPNDLIFISDKNQSEGQPGTYLDLEPPLPYPINLSLQKKLHRAIQSLPKQQKQIIRLVLKGLSNKEIASRLKISAKQVATQKSNAIKRLKKLVLS